MASSQGKIPLLVFHGRCLGKVKPKKKELKRSLPVTKQREYRKYGKNLNLFVFIEDILSRFNIQYLRYSPKINVYSVTGSNEHF